MAAKNWSPFEAGYRLLNGHKFNDLFTGAQSILGLNVSGYLAQSVAGALTAVGTTRATGLALTKQINDVTTAAASTGVVLPLGTAVGLSSPIVIFNAGANAITVYASGSDTIDGVAGATGVPLTNAHRCIYFPISVSGGVTTWISAQLGVVSA
jgi:hypothetical protein